MTTLTATFSNPKNNYVGAGGLSATVPIIEYENPVDFDSISTLVLTVRTEVESIYKLETNDTTNAIQENSTVTISDGTTTWFYGYVISKKRVVVPGAGSVLQVMCNGPDAILMNALCCNASGDYVFTMESDHEDVSQMPLVATSSYGNFQGSTLWPDPTDADGAKCYLKDAVANSDALDVNIGIGDYAITAISAGAGGYFDIGSEVDDEFIADDTFTISGSTNNDGTWTVASASWTGAVTRITVIAGETVGAVADGTIHQPNTILSTTNQGFVPRGWVKIETEWIYFDGYDDAAADNKYRLRNVVRAGLGTAAAAHLATTTVYEKRPKQIAPVTIKLEHDPGTGYVTLRRDKEYSAMVDLCAFALPDVAAGSYRVTFGVYDEDSSFATYAITAVSTGAGGWFEVAENIPDEFTVNDKFTISGSTNNNGTWTVASAAWTGAATRITVPAGETVGAVANGYVNAHYAITLNDIIETLVTGPKAYGGPGFVAGDCNFDCSSIKFNRYDYDPDGENSSMYVWDEIMGVLQSVSLEDDVRFWYKHADAKFRLAILANAAASFAVPHMERLDDENSLENVYSGIRVAYQDDTKLNRANATYAYHQAATGAGASPDTWVRTTAGGESYQWGTNTENAAAGTFGIDMAVDGKTATKLTASFTHNPAGSFTFGDFWFGTGTTPPKIKFDEIVFKFGAYRSIDNTQTYKNNDWEYGIRFQAATDYNSTTHNGTFEDIGFEIRGKPNPMGGYAEAKASAPFRMQSGNCIRIIWDYMAGPSTGVDNYYAPIHSLEIFGNTTKYVLVQLTDDTSDIGDVQKLYAPDTFEKLRGGIKATAGVAGSPRVKHYPIGASSDGAALSMGRTLLKTYLQKSNTRSYSYSGLFPAAPHLGLTIEVDDDNDSVVDFTGVIHGYNISKRSNGPWECTATLQDHSASVLT